MITFELLSPGKHLPDAYWKERAPGARRIEIEIGPGDGRFLLSAADAHPDTLFVGFEIRRSWAENLRADAALPDNAHVLNADGRWLVEHLLADASIDAFHVYFPDPWWKKRHAKRRLCTPDFAAAVRRCLKPQGSLYLITDVVSVFDDMTGTLQAAGLSAHPWQRDADDPAQSSYERKYRRQQRTLHGCRFENPAD